MNLKLNSVLFLIKLLEDSRTELYIKMRDENYSMWQILDFVNGYTSVIRSCDRIVCDKVHTPDRYDEIIFEDYSDMMNSFDVLLRIIYDDKDSYSGWEILGAKYALCLIKYYIIHVIFGDVTEVCDLYLSLPDRYEPNSYEWDERGWDYDFFNEDI